MSWFGQGRLCFCEASTRLTSKHHHRMASYDWDCCTGTIWSRESAPEIDMMCIGTTTSAKSVTWTLFHDKSGINCKSGACKIRSFTVSVGGSHGQWMKLGVSYFFNDSASIFFNNRGRSQRMRDSAIGQVVPRAIPTVTVLTDGFSKEPGSLMVPLKITHLLVTAYHWGQSNVLRFPFWLWTVLKLECMVLASP